MRSLPDSPFKAALLLPRWLGDAVMSSTLISPLANLSGKPVEVWGPAAFEKLFAAGGDIAGYRTYEGKGIHRGFSGLRRLRNEVADQAPDALWLIPDSFSSAVAAKMSGVKIRVGRGVQARCPLLSHALRDLQRDRQRHWAEEKADLLRCFQSDLAPIEPLLNLSTSQNDFMLYMKERGLSEGNYAVYAPGALFGPAKRWDGFTDLAARLPTDLEIVLIGSKNEESALLALEEAIKRQGRKVRCFAGELDLAQVARLCQASRFTISNDSGVMHLAAGAGAPVLGLFLSTDPRWTAPLGPQARFLAADVNCRPCFKRTCPLDEMICQSALNVDLVLETLGDWLETS
jgi:heptosyltransferase-2